ncbi:MAG: sigma-70 family RNA polymerase sigma factor, partial [Candidatus Hydrogenedentes bacterium]|nr:sigma-70 family RNA polymerase sigma factor [Candidatus Hydrogenedentota bacterium]
MWKRDKPPDAHLVAQVLAGTPDAFSVLVERYLGLAHAVAYACSLSREDAEDIVQESFLKAFRSLHGLREPARFASWLTRIVHNTGCSLMESRRLDRMVRAAVEPPPAEMSSPFRDEMHELLKRRMQELTPQEREVLTLHYYAGKTTREVAALLGISRDAAKKRIERARNTLGAALIADLMPAVEPADSPRDARVRGIVALCLAEPVVRPPVPAAPMSLPFGIKGVSVATAAALVVFSVPLIIHLPRGEKSDAPPTAAAAAVAPAQLASTPIDVRNTQDPREILSIYKAQQDKLQRFTVSWYMEKDLISSRGNLRIYENGQLSQDSPKK